LLFKLLFWFRWIFLASLIIFSISYLFCLSFFLPLFLWLHPFLRLSFNLSENSIHVKLILLHFFNNNSCFCGQFPLFLGLFSLFLSCFSFLFAFLLILFYLFLFNYFKMKIFPDSNLLIFFRWLKWIWLLLWHQTVDAFNHFIWNQLLVGLRV